MTLLEYITDLQSQGLSGEEIFAKAQEFKDRTKPEEVVEEVKTEVVADQAGAAVTTTTEEASDTASESEDGFSESLDGRSLSSNFVPGTLDFYQARVANLGLSIEEEAKAINNMAVETSGAMGLITEDQFQKKIKVNTSSGYQLYTEEELQKFIDDKQGEIDSGFRNVKTVEDYVRVSPHVSYVAGLDPELYASGNVYRGTIDGYQPYNQMQEITKETTRRGGSRTSN